MPIFDPFSVPGYREALDQEREDREIPFLDLPETLCGIEVRPFTPLALLRLDAAKNAFAVGGFPNEIDIGFFLMVVSADYTTPSRFEQAIGIAWLRCFLFGRRIRKLKSQRAIEQIDAYLKAAYADSPGDTGQNSESTTCWAATLVHQLATRYGWTEEYVLNLPFQRIFQYLYLIRREINPDAQQFSKAQSVVNRHFAELNRKVSESRKN